MKEIVLYLTDRKDWIADRMPLQDSTLCTLEQGVLFHQKETDYDSDICNGLYENVYPFTSDILFDLGYKPIGDSLVPGNAHFGSPDIVRGKPYPKYQRNIAYFS